MALVTSNLETAINSYSSNTFFRSFACELCRLLLILNTRSFEALFVTCVGQYRCACWRNKNGPTARHMVSNTRRHNYDPSTMMRLFEIVPLVVPVLDVMSCKSTVAYEESPRQIRNYCNSNTNGAALRIAAVSLNVKRIRLSLLAVNIEI
jgi:hypothetical protein